MSAIRQERLVRLFDGAVVLNGERLTPVIPSARVTTFQSGDSNFAVHGAVTVRQVTVHFASHLDFPTGSASEV